MVNERELTTEPEQCWDGDADLSQDVQGAEDFSSDDATAARNALRSPDDAAARGLPSFEITDVSQRNTSAYPARAVCAVEQDRNCAMSIENARREGGRPQAFRQDARLRDPFSAHDSYTDGRGTASPFDRLRPFDFEPTQPADRADKHLDGSLPSDEFLDRDLSDVPAFALPQAAPSEHYLPRVASERDVNVDRSGTGGDAPSTTARILDGLSLESALDDALSEQRNLSPEQRFFLREVHAGLVNGSFQRVQSALQRMDRTQVPDAIGVLQQLYQQRGVQMFMRSDDGGQLHFAPRESSGYVPVVTVTPGQIQARSLDTGRTFSETAAMGAFAQRYTPPSLNHLTSMMINPLRIRLSGYRY